MIASSLRIIGVLDDLHQVQTAEGARITACARDSARHLAGLAGIQPYVTWRQAGQGIQSALPTPGPFRAGWILTG